MPVVQLPAEPSGPGPGEVAVAAELSGLSTATEQPGLAAVAYALGSCFGWGGFRLLSRPPRGSWSG